MEQDQTLTEPVVKEVSLDAPVSRVWKALTNKNELKQWCFDMNAFEPKAGFEFQFYGEKDGHKFLHLCKVLEAEPQKKMKWLWSYQGVPGDTYVSFELFPQGNQTKLILTHEGLEKLPQDENYAKENFIGGWNMILGELLPKFLSENK
jgi:uncharacterized protein YndB with AHSA1/START domain